MYEVVRTRYTAYQETSYMDVVGVDISKARQLLEEPRAIAFYAIVTGDAPEARRAYVRHMNPMRLAKKGFVLLQLGDTLDRLESEVFAIDGRVDIVVRPDRFDVFDKAFFESTFFDLMSASDELDELVSSAVSHLPVAKPTLALIVEKARNRRRARRKMLEIRASGHLESVTLADFKRALNEHHGLPISRFIRKDADGNEIINADDDDGDPLLEILNEDLFKGALTGRTLSASGKSVKTSL